MASTAAKTITVNVTRAARASSSNQFDMVHPSKRLRRRAPAARGGEGPVRPFTRVLVREHAHWLRRIEHDGRARPPPESVDGARGQRLATALDVFRA